MLVIGKRLLQFLTAASILFFLGTFVWVMFLSTNSCSSCGASGLWGYSVLASAPTCLLAVLTIIGRRKLSTIHVPFSGILSLLAVEVFALGLALGAASPFIFEHFFESYGVAYFQWVPMPFASSMILLLVVTLGLVSFNLAVAVREPLKSEEKWSVGGSWVRVGRNFLMFFGLVLLLQDLEEEALVQASNLQAFSVMMMSMMMIPLFSLYLWIEKRGHLVRLLIGGFSAFSLLEIVVHLRAFVGLMNPTHPFLVIPVLSLLLVCIGCTVGEVGVFVVHPIRLSRRGVLMYAVVVASVLLFVFMTWMFTRSEVGVWL